MSHDTDTTSPADAQGSDVIHTEPAPFEPGYQPESLPKISVPDLHADAEGLTAEALAQVPTLTDSLDPEPEPEPEPLPTVATEAAPAQIQDVPVQADTWVEELHQRIGKLTGDIHTLNARLDRLEERNNAKV